MIVVGGGYVACEFAAIMNGLGTRVIQLYRGEQILRGFDDDLRDHVAAAMRDRGIVLEVGRDVVGIERDERAARGAGRQRRDARRRSGAVRDRAPPEHRGARARGARGRHRRERRGRGRPVVADRGAVDLRRRRRHRPPRADAGGDRRGAGLRRDGVRRAGRGRSTTASSRPRSSPGPRRRRSG